MSTFALGCTATLRRIDQIVLVGIGLLVVFTPLFLGSVHPWAYSLMEQVCFALVLAWIVKAWLDGGRLLRRGGRVAAAAVVAPIALLVGLLAFETVPLPPGLLARLSPGAYRLYAQVLPGWPKHPAYRNIDFNVKPRLPNGPVILPTARQVRAGAAVPFTPPTAVESGHADESPQAQNESSSDSLTAHGSSNRIAANSAASAPLERSSWRALSFEPEVTRAILLKGVAYAAIFLLVALYPFGAPGEPRSEEHFCRAVLAMVLVAGFGIAFIGLVNWATWNGKILWFFIPLDWGKPEFGMLRASGPFIDPDHFANYLAMIFPFAMAGGLFRTDLVSRRWATPIRVGSVILAFIIVCALILSLSRGAWAATAFGVALLIVMFLLQSEERRAVFARHSNARNLKWAAVGAIGLFVLALLFVGPQGRNLSIARLSPGAGRVTMAERTVLWHGSLAMSRKFPLFGVGLGAWAEMFTRYAPRPWSQFFFYREAHNDYLQFLADAGLLAMLVLLWLAWRVLRRIAAGLRSADARKWPLIAAVLAAAGAMALHETVDFNLQVPSNALLLAILLGLGLRVATPPRPGDEIRRGRIPRAILALAAGAAAALIFATVGQHDIYYPDFLPRVKTLPEAVARVEEHPADSQSHFILANLGEGVMTHKAQLQELRSAVWLDPTNPHKRDAYASMLAKQGDLKLAETQVRLSVFNSPSTETHFYLRPELIHWLAPATRVAVERGYNEAIAAGVHGALKGLGNFYALSDRPLKEAQLDSVAAGRAKDPERRLDLLLGAGQAYAAAGYFTVADALFRIAMEKAPNSPYPYLNLVRNVYGPDRDMRSAAALIENAIKTGQDPYRFSMVLAGAANQARNAKIEEAALKSALAVIPDDIQALTALGEFYLNHRRYDDALMTFEKAVQANPDSARLRFDLGRAQEYSYHYYDAQQSFARAVALAPGNHGFSTYYADFKERMVKETAALNKTEGSQPAALPRPAEVSQPSAMPTPATAD